jgi:hypothetical protein
MSVTSRRRDGCNERNPEHDQFQKLIGPDKSETKKYPHHDLPDGKKHHDAEKNHEGSILDGRPPALQPGKDSVARIGRH